MEKLIEIMKKYGIEDCAPLSLDFCRITKTYLLEKLPFTPKTAVCGLIPYYPESYDKAPEKNISVYAAPRDYHFFVAGIKEKLIREAEAACPGHSFALFSDHSPLDERDAALKAGLGVMGHNGLLISRSHSSFVFICELITDLETDREACAPAFCENCGLCEKACPVHMDMSRCLSALTQKKGGLTESEILTIRESNCVWGCDICQQACPHTEKARQEGTLYSPIPFFNEKVNSCPEICDIDKTEDFKTRAYSWRGPDTIKRNINIMNVIVPDTGSANAGGKK